MSAQGSASTRPGAPKALWLPRRNLAWVCRYTRQSGHEPGRATVAHAARAPQAHRHHRRHGFGQITLLRHIAAQDIARGDGILLLDPHGDLAEAVLSDVPPSRYNHVCYLNLAERDFPVGMNVLEDTEPDDRARVVDGFVAAMRSIFYELWGPRMEIILRHASTALIETQNASLFLLPRLLIDDEFRMKTVAHLTNHDTRTFFGARFDKWRDAFREEAIDPVLNKVDAFLAFPTIRNILGQGRSTLHLPYAMQEGRIVICNLATGTVGETAARLFGALLLAHLRAAAMARASFPRRRSPFHLYADEAHTFGPASIARLLSETRKFVCRSCSSRSSWMR